MSDFTINLEHGHAVGNVTFRMEPALSKHWRVNDGGYQAARFLTLDRVRELLEDPRTSLILVAPDLREKSVGIIEEIERGTPINLDLESGYEIDGMYFVLDERLENGQWQVGEALPFDESVHPLRKTYVLGEFEAHKDNVPLPVRFYVSPTLKERLEGIVQEIAEESRAKKVAILTEEGKRGTLAEGVVIREHASLADGLWQIEGVAGPAAIFRHGERVDVGHPYAVCPFNIEVVATQILQYGNRSFALAKDLYRSIGPEVMEELTKRAAPAAAGPGMKLKPVEHVMPGRGVRRPESRPEDKLWVETTLGDAEEILRENSDLITPKVGATGRLVEALQAAATAHREGWRELPPVVAKIQSTDGADVARRGQLFANGSRVRFTASSGRPADDSYVVMSSTFVGEGTEPGCWQYALSEDGTSAKALHTNPHREDELEAALPVGAGLDPDEPTEEEKKQDIADRLVADIVAIGLALEGLKSIPGRGRLTAVEMYLSAWKRADDTFTEAEEAWGIEAR